MARELGLVLEKESGPSFEDDSCLSQIVPPQALGNMLAAHKAVECVVLNACFSSTHVESSLTDVDYSILMDGPISDAGAMEFSRGFYDAVAAGKSIDFAFGEGCRRIDLKGHLDAELPLLYAKGVKVTSKPPA